MLTPNPSRMAAPISWRSAWLSRSFRLIRLESDSASTVPSAPMKVMRMPSSVPIRSKVEESPCTPSGAVSICIRMSTASRRALRTVSSMPSSLMFLRTYNPGSTSVITMTAKKQRKRRVLNLVSRMLLLAAVAYAAHCFDDFGGVPELVPQAADMGIHRTA